MTNVILENLVSVFTTLLIMLIGVPGTWPLAQELQQAVAEGLKNANEDNKLTKEEIEKLGILLLDKTTEKLSVPTYDLINAAGIDINALITGAGEAWIQQLKAKRSWEEIPAGILISGNE